MDEITSTTITIAILAGVAIACFVAVSAGHSARGIMMRDLAHRLGLVYAKDSKHHFLTGLLQKMMGRECSARLRLHGKYEGNNIQIVDYHFVTHGYDFTMLMMSAGMSLSPMVIRPERLVDRYLSFFGEKDLDFESLAFSEHFFVDAVDREWAYQTLTPKVIEYLMQYHGYTIVFCDDQILLSIRESIMEPPQIEAGLRFLAGFKSHLEGSE